MDSFSYARSVQQQAQSSYGNTLEQYNQERQIATAHFEAEKKEIVDPLAFIGGGMATSAAGSLGKKIAAKSGIKAFEKLGQESISTTMKNAAKEALEKGKSALTGKINGTIQNAISKDGGKADTINNVENVFIQIPARGKWTVEVSAFAVNQDGHMKTVGVDDVAFALVVSGAKKVTAK